MRIKKLDRHTVEAIYPQLEEAFPGDELKPLDRMLVSCDAGTYECFGLYEGDEIRGCAYFARTGRDWLLDYFCVFEGHRSAGMGTEFLRLLAEGFDKYDSVIAEVEDPGRAQDEESRRLQERRVGFYLRGGFINTGVRVYVFGVHYLLLEYAGCKAHTGDDIRRVYSAHYRAMLPDEMYKANIVI